MVLALDYLDSMMWALGASGILLGVALLRIPYNAKTDAVEDSGRNLSAGLGIAIGVTGLYLFITGTAIGLQWPFPFSSGAYNVLFGGAAVFGGLVLLATSAVFFLGRGLKAISYLAAVMGIYLTVDAFSIRTYNLTSDPFVSTLLYLSVAVASFLSIPATHSDNKWMRRTFAVFAFAFAFAWLYFVANVTYVHLKP